MAAREYFVGAISGTSIDGLDLALVAFQDEQFELIDAHCTPIPDTLKSKLVQLCADGEREIERFGQADVELGLFIGNSILAFLEKSNVAPSSVHAIGSHGQTIRHRPDVAYPFSLQIGNGAAIAEQTGISTIVDFRMADMAAKGQGAPLVPAFHRYAFSSQHRQRLIINLGGISNISVLPKLGSENETRGYDIGPANGLMDRWIEQQQGKHFDQDGNWARSGKVIPTMLEKMLNEPYFKQPIPKSTGREHFNLIWLSTFLNERYAAEDVQRTLLELSAQVVADAVRFECTRSAADQDTESEVVLCGGGARNSLLVERIKHLCAPYEVAISDAIGLPADDVESVTFAWLARETLERRPGSIASVTGATKTKVLGAIYYP